MRQCAATTTIRLKVLVTAAFALALLAAPPAWAQGETAPARWWLGLDLGAGRLRQTIPGLWDETTPRFFMGLSGGVVVTPQLLVGGELSGWLIRAGELYGPDEGAGVMQVFAMARIYPSKMSAFHVRLGAGLVDNWERTYDYSYDTGGLGWEIGVGYDMKVGRRFYLTPFIAYYGGKIGNMNMDQGALTGGLGFVWR
jgi:Outer membrane protein beta-barrel domain